MSEKKRDIIFEVPKEQIPLSVQALMAKAEEKLKDADAIVGDFLGEPLEIDLHITNDKVLFSMPDTGRAAPAMAKSIIKAVQEYEVVGVDMTPNTRVAARLGETAVKYERRVRIDWQQKKIFTNFSPSDGNAFLGAMAIVVENLQSGNVTESRKPQS